MESPDQAEWESLRQEVESLRRKVAAYEHQEAQSGLPFSARDVLESLADGCLVLDRESRCLYANQHAETMLEKSHDDLIGHILWEALPELTGARGAAQRAIDSQTVARFDQYVRSRDEWLEGSVHPVSEGLALFIRDITLRKRMERSVRESEERFRTLAETMPDLIWIAEQSGGAVYCNQYGREYLGLDAHADGLSWISFLVPQDAEKARDWWREVLEGRDPGELVVHFRRAQDQDNRAHLLRAAPLHDSLGGVARWFLVGSDIHDRRLAETDLRDAHEKLQAIVQYSPLPIVAFDRTGGVTLWNPAAERLFGWTEAEVLGGPLPFIPEEKRAEHRAMRLRDLEGQTFKDQVIRRKRKDGSWIDLRVSTAALRDLSGAVTGIISLYVDITEQKRAEQELQDANRSLTQANEDLNQFAYSASHDLREPLRTVILNCQLVERGYAHLLDEEGQDCIHQAVEAGKRTEHLLRDLLSYTRIASLTPSAGLPPVDAGLMLRNVIENLQAAITSNDAEVIAGELPCVRAHEVHLQQLFQNLIGNALKYRSERKPVIEISCYREGSEWVFRVSDNGMGIDPRFHKQIFGLFKRLHGSDLEGTGIGLALCQRIVHRYNGRIWVASEEGKGSQFFFSLPSA